MMMLSYTKSNSSYRCETAAVAGTFMRELEILGTVLLAVSIIVAPVLVALYL